MPHVFHLTVASTVLLVLPSLTFADDGLPAGAKIRLGSPELRSLFAYHVGISPDGKLLAYRSDVDGLTVCDPATGKILRRVPIRDKEIGEECFYTADGKHLVFTGISTCCLVDAVSGKVMGKFEVPGAGGPFDRPVFRWSGDGKQVVSFGAFGGGPYKLWDMATGKMSGEINAAQNGGDKDAVFSSNGRILATCGMRHSKKNPQDEAAEEFVELWNPQTRKVQSRLHLGANNGVFQIALSPDGKYLVACTSGRSSLQLWNAADAKKVADLEADPLGRKMFTFAPDGKSLALQTDQGQACLWETATGKKVAAKKTTPGRPAGVGFKEDGDVLSCMVEGNQVKVQSLLKPPPAAATPRPGHTAPVMQSAFSADGKSLLTVGQDQRICRWDVESGKFLEQVIHKPASAGAGWGEPSLFSPDRSRFATAALGHFELFDLDARKEVARLKTSADYYPRWTSVAFSADGKKLLARGTAQEKTPTGWKLESVPYVASWDAATGRVLAEHAGPARGMTPDQWFLKHFEKETLALPDAALPEVVPGKAVRDPWASSQNAGAINVGQQLTVKDRKTQKVLLDVELPLNGGRGISIRGDGKLLAVPLIDATVLLIEIPAAGK